MRYLPLTQDDRAEMLKTIGAKSVDDFYADVPESARLHGKIDGLPDHQGELAVERHMSNLAAKNRAASSGLFFVGAGAYMEQNPFDATEIIRNHPGTCAQLLGRRWRAGCCCRRSRRASKAGRPVRAAAGG